jgi:F-type H+-transporting ATPase subunit epsilon
MAEYRIQLDIVTPDKLAFSGEVDEVNLSGALGEFGVLPGHTPLLSELKIGTMHFRREGRMEWLAMSQGIAEVTPKRVTVLVQTAEQKAEIDVVRAEAARARAEERIRSREAGMDVFRAEAALQKALARLKVAKIS